MRTRKMIALAVSGALAALHAKSSFATTGTWTPTIGGSWQTGANWSGGTPNAIDDIAIINPNTSAISNITLDAPVILGNLSIGDSTSTYFSYTLSSNGSANTLTFQTSSGDAQLSRGTSTTNQTDTISATTVLNSTLDITMANNLASFVYSGPISGSGGIIRKVPSAGGANTTLVYLSNQNNSYSGVTAVQDGTLQFSGSVLSGQNSAFGNATTAIQVSNANSLTIAGTPVTLQMVSLDDSSNYTIDRGIDFSGSPTSSGANLFLRFNANNAGSSNTNTLLLSGPTTINANRDMTMVAQATGMTMNFTGLITGGASARSVNIGENYGAPTAADGVIGNASYRFSNVNNSFAGNIVLNSGTVTIAGNVAATGNSPIGIGGSKGVGVYFGGGAGDNIVGYSGTTGGTGVALVGASAIRSVFMETGGTTFARNLGTLSGGRGVTNATPYGTGTINVVNGYRFGESPTTATNLSSPVIWSGSINPGLQNVGDSDWSGFSGTNKITIPGNVALFAASGGTTIFTGGITESGTAVPSTGTAVSGTEVATRVTINQFRNNPYLDSNDDGIADTGQATGNNANEWIGTPTTGVVKLTNSGAWTGSTDVAGGTLLIDNAVPSSTPIAPGGVVTVYPGATLGGFGAINAGISGTVEVNGTIQPGDFTASSNTSASQLTIAKLVNFNANSTLAITLNGGALNTNPALTTASYGRLTVTNASTGAVNINSSAGLNVTLGYQASNGTAFQVLSVPNGTLTGTFANLSGGTLVSSTLYNSASAVAASSGGVSYKLGTYYQPTGLYLIAETGATWVSSSDGNFSGAANWDHGLPNDSNYVGTVQVMTTGASATFGNAAATVVNVTADVNDYLDQLTFNDTNPGAGYNILGAYSIQTSVLNVSSGVNTINLSSTITVTNSVNITGGQLSIISPIVNYNNTTSTNGTYNVSGSGQLTLGATSGGTFIVSGSGVINLTGASSYGLGATVNGGTLVISNTTGTALSGNITLNGGTLASGLAGNISTGVVAGIGAHTIAPGGIGSIGSLTIGSLNSNSNTTINFDLGTGSGPVITTGDLLTLGSGTSVIGTGTNLTFTGTPVTGDKYQLLADSNGGTTLSGLNLGHFILPTPTGSQTYSLSIISGYLDLVVGSAGPSTLTFNSAGGPGSGTTWDTTSLNWNNGSGVVAYNDSSNGTSGDIVTFSDVNSGHYAVAISGVVHPTSTTFNTANISGYSITGANASSGIAGSGSLTLLGTGLVTLASNNTYTGGTFVNAGILKLASATAFPAQTSLNISSGATVIVANHGGGSVVVPVVSLLNNSGTIDLTNNALRLQGANGSIGTVISQIRQAYNFGTWNGTNSSSGVITSSFAGSDSTHLTAIGYATGLSTFEGATVSPSDVLVKYTYYGDATLDGKVDGSDYSRIDSGYVTGLTGWYNGDFNYDGVINGSDYTLIDNAFNTQGASLAAAIASPTAIATAEVAGTSAVPEPTTLTLLGIGTGALLGRRRRRFK